jgi:hypothetical protein
MEDQPAPIPVEKTNRTPVWNLVRDDFADLMKRSTGVDLYALTIELIGNEMLERDQTGRERYGTPLTAGNGRDHLVDAYQEILDFAVYLRTWFDEERINPRDEEMFGSRAIQLRGIYVNTLANIVMFRQAMLEDLR